MVKGGSSLAEVSLNAGSLSLVRIQLPVQAGKHGSQALLLGMCIALLLLHIANAHSCKVRRILRTGCMPTCGLRQEGGLAGKSNVLHVAGLCVCLRPSDMP